MQTLKHLITKRLAVKWWLPEAGENSRYRGKGKGLLKSNN